ncbi:MAG: hypothetical protein N3J91_09300 [Verrucomicrobiae bacterium]|nr:hypothetical protein [Verrucomicrobiae bacterium]
MFPQARSPMREYFATLEQLWIAMDHQHERKLFRWNNQFLLGTPEQQTLARRARTLLDEAAATAAPRAEKARVEFFAKSYRVTEFLFAFAQAQTLAPEQLAAARKHAALLSADPLAMFGPGPEGRFLANFEAALKTVTAGKTSP